MRMLSAHLVVCLVEKRDNRVRCYPSEEREMNGKRYLYYVEAEAIRGI